MFRMFGNIALGLLVVVCFSCIVTEALSNLPVVDNLSACNAYEPRASFSQIKSLGFVAKFSSPGSPCLTVDIKPTFEIPQFNVGIYNSTKHINRMGNITSGSSLLIQIPTKPGYGLSFIKNENGTYDLHRVSVIVAYVPGDGCNFKGYILVSCTSTGAKQVAVFVKDVPPKPCVVKALEAQLAGTDLANITLNTIHQGNDCIYKP